MTIHFLGKYSLCMWEVTVKKWFVEYFFLIFFFSFFVFRFFWGWYGVWNRNSTIRLRLPPPKKKYWKNYLTIHFLEKYSLCMCEFTVKKWFVKYFFQYFLWGGECEVEFSNFDFRCRTTPKKNEKPKTKKKY